MASVEMETKRIDSGPGVCGLHLDHILILRAGAGWLIWNKERYGATFFGLGESDKGPRAGRGEKIGGPSCGGFGGPWSSVGHLVQPRNTHKLASTYQTF